MKVGRLLDKPSTSAISKFLNAIFLILHIM